MINSNVYNCKAESRLTERFTVNRNAAYVRMSLQRSSIVTATRRSFRMLQSFMAVLGRARRILDTASWHLRQPDAGDGRLGGQARQRLDKMADRGGAGCCGCCSRYGWCRVHYHDARAGRSDATATAAVSPRAGAPRQSPYVPERNRRVDREETTA